MKDEFGEVASGSGRQRSTVAQQQSSEYITSFAIIPMTRLVYHSSAPLRHIN